MIGIDFEAPHCNTLGQWPSILENLQDPRLNRLGYTSLALVYQGLRAGYDPSMGRHATIQQLVNQPFFYAEQFFAAPGVSWRTPDAAVAIEDRTTPEARQYYKAAHALFSLTRAAGAIVDRAGGFRRLQHIEQGQQRIHTPTEQGDISLRLTVHDGIVNGIGIVYEQDRYGEDERKRHAGVHITGRYPIGLTGPKTNTIRFDAIQTDGPEGFPHLTGSTVTSGHPFADIHMLSEGVLLALRDGVQEEA